MNAIGYAILVFVLSRISLLILDEWVEIGPWVRLLYSALLALATLLIMWR